MHAFFLFLGYCPPKHRRGHTCSLTYEGHRAAWSLFSAGSLGPVPCSVLGPFLVDVSATCVMTWNAWSIIGMEMHEEVVGV